jgi:osmotically-inducible protein OsmY
MDKLDIDVQHEVIAALAWEPRVVQPSNIGIAVTDGVVTLSGTVKSYPEKLAAEKATRRVDGVKAIAEEIKVHLGSDPKTADHEIAKRIVDVFSWNERIPNERMAVTVESGWVTLSGEVDWTYQNEEANNAVGRIEGVVGITNHVAVLSLPVAADLRDRVLGAFKRQAEMDACSLSIETKGSVVKLGGSVKSRNERAIAARVVEATPGVTKVRNHIQVER